jgi:hemolysin activation/secretion protein
LAIAWRPVAGCSLEATADVGYEGGAYYRKYGLFGIDDRFTFYGTHSEANGSNAGSVSYNLPVDHSGGRLGISYSRSVIKIIEGPFLPLDVTRSSQVGSLSFSHPLWADDSWLVLGNFSESYGTSKSNQADMTILFDRTWKETPGITFAKRADDMSFSISPAVSFAHSMLAGSTNVQEYELFNGTGSANVQFPAGFYATLGGAYQVSSRQVLPGDQLFQIGGPTTVRGYSTNAVAGFTGYLLCEPGAAPKLGGPD